MSEEKKPEAIRLAEWIEIDMTCQGDSEIAAELRRLHARVQEMAVINAAERQRRQEAELMAECMNMVRHDLIAAGIIDKSVPPMMIPEAVIAAMRNAGKEGRKPLTGVRILEIETRYTDCETDPYHPRLELFEFVRAVERAHGITG